MSYMYEPKILYTGYSKRKARRALRRIGLYRVYASDMVKLARLHGEYIFHPNQWDLPEILGVYCVKTSRGIIYSVGCI